MATSFETAGGLGIQIEGLSELMADLKTIEDNATRYQIHQAAALRVKEMQTRHFQTQRDSSGAPWAPLSPLTIALRGGGSASILRDKGALEASISVLSDSSTGWEVGTRMAKAFPLQFGAVIKPRTGDYLAIPVNKKGMKARGKGSAKSFIFLKGATLPAREFLYLDAQEQNELMAFYGHEMASRGTSSIQWTGGTP